MLEQAIASLKDYDWGKDKAVLQPIEEAVVATHGNAEDRKKLETSLAAVLTTDVPFDAKQYVCRKLMVIGTAESVPSLADLLTDEKLAHSARYALERIDAPEAAQALRDALAKTNGALKIGVISSLGARGDAPSVAPLGALLGDSDGAVARAAAIALGAIRSPEAAKVLGAAKATDQTKSVIADAQLACAENLLATGKKAQAKVIYMGLLGKKPASHVKLAATRGLLACAGQ